MKNITTLLNNKKDYLKVSLIDIVNNPIKNNKINKTIEGAFSNILSKSSLF